MTAAAPYAVVVAHPDDEALWLSSVLADADRTILCYGAPHARPARATARRNAVAALELPGLVDLAIPESGAGFSFDRRKPVNTDTGLAITDPAAAVRYQANFESLVTALRPLLAGYAAVYTHNPWGEYGHAEHVQVYRAVSALQPELGYTQWFSNYVGGLSWHSAVQLADTIHWRERRDAAPDLMLAHRLRGVYLRHRAWTWYRHYRWPTAETLYAQAALTHANDNTLRGESLIDVDALHGLSTLWRSPYRLVR